MNICVIGSGYVGLVTGACLADFGMNVVGVDKDHAKVEALSRGKVPIYEPGLDTLVQKNMAEGRLRFTTDLAPRHRGGAGDLHRRRHAAEVGRLGRPHLHPRGRRLDRRAPQRLQDHHHQEHGADRHRPDDRGASCARGRAASTRFAVVSNPEFLREGSAIEDFMHPDRVVIGTRDERAAEMMMDVYSPLARRRRAVHRHRRRDGRADQVRLQRLPGHQDLVHQRGGAHLRGLGRQRRGGLARGWGSTTGSARSSSRPAPATAAPASPRTPAPRPRSPATRG